MSKKKEKYDKYSYSEAHLFSRSFNFNYLLKQYRLGIGDCIRYKFTIPTYKPSFTQVPIPNPHFYKPCQNLSGKNFFPKNAKDFLVNFFSMLKTSNWCLIFFEFEYIQIETTFIYLFIFIWIFMLTSILIF